jgi:hypothetical protein
MTKVNTKKANATVSPNVTEVTVTNIAEANPILTYVSGKARAEHNSKRAKAVKGMTYAKALEYYGTLYPKGAKTHLNYDIFKIKSLKPSS